MVMWQALVTPNAQIVLLESTLICLVNLHASRALLVAIWTPLV